MARARDIGRMYWHPDVHKEWTGRDLYFWFFAFSTVYSPDDVVHALRDVFQELKVTSYGLLELLGSFDLLARLYVEPSREDAVASALEDRLQPLGLIRSMSFHVGAVLRDWVWEAADDTTVRRPDPNAVREHLPAAELAILNSAQGAAGPRDLIDHYTHLGLLTTASHSYGIGLVVLIGTGDAPANRTRRLVGRRVAGVLDRARDFVIEYSLYEGRGGQRELLLIQCRVEHDGFHRLSRELIEPLRQVVTLAAATVVAFPVVSADFVIFQDLLALDAPASQDARALLEGDESRAIEVKGSLFAPLDPWLRSGAELEEVSNYPLKGVLKAIVGLLNSGGGSVIIGAVEHARYSGATSAAARLDSYPRVGRYSIVGLLDPSYRISGWDTWSRRLRDLIAGRIDPNPGVLVQIRAERLMDQNICVIDVHDPGEDAFYLKTASDRATFYARQGTEVVPLIGSRIDAHRKQVRRLR